MEGGSGAGKELCAGSEDLYECGIVQVYGSSD